MLSGEPLLALMALPIAELHAELEEARLWLLLSPPSHQLIVATPGTTTDGSPTSLAPAVTSVVAAIYHLNYPCCDGTDGSVWCCDSPC